MHVEWQNSITIFLNICISHAIHAWYIYLYIYLYNPIHASDGSIETLFIYLNLFGIGVFWVDTLQLHLAEYEKIGFDDGLVVQVILLVGGFNPTEKY